MREMKCILTLALCAIQTFAVAQDQTYAEKLGWAKGDKVLIVHIDDAGMSHDSNLGTIKALETGMANSFSVMMPCPWVPEIAKYIVENPDTDPGLHLTLTSEWPNYRWGPLVGKPTAPGLVDGEGALWKSVSDVIKHATADEVDMEIRAQLARARAIGFEPPIWILIWEHSLPIRIFWNDTLIWVLRNKSPSCFPPATTPSWVWTLWA